MITTLCFIAQLCLFGVPQPIIDNTYKLPHRSQLRDTSFNYIVIHYDSSENTKSTFRFLRKRKTAYHFYIDTLGKIYNFIDVKYRASHAGLSYYDSKFGMNAYSIGICLQGYGNKPFKNIQYVSLNYIIHNLRMRYLDLIPESRIVGHSDVAIPRGRKKDPGPYFEWYKVKPFTYMNWQEINTRISAELRRDTL